MGGRGKEEGAGGRGDHSRMCEVQGKERENIR